ncbi:hypothetical protein W911_07985 [Hyphomicrobium nitrativorans NL23]|uniref:Uncharacterized protein n=1 Tax=Hyphomicrobium nitrativorans NL23 TaxID=1029756 RepID=V5SHS8_9HYPH|nr:hypothetical protein W911_07985 [Hyphomicrobium nitrativorans NL23]
MKDVVERTIFIAVGTPDRDVTAIVRELLIAANLVGIVICAYVDFRHL